MTTITNKTFDEDLILAHSRKALMPWSLVSLISTFSEYQSVPIEKICLIPCTENRNVSTALTTLFIK